MKDPSGVIRTWLYTLLNGTITYGSAIPAYSFPPKDAAKPYILIAEQSSIGEDGTKDTYISKHLITIEIYSSHTGNDASYVPINTVSDSVIQKVRTRSKITLSGYNVISCTFDGALTDRIDFDTEIVLIKVLNFTLTIAEE